MAFYDKFPYTNFQELNLDWLTQEVSKVRDNRNATDASAAAALASEQAAKASETAAAASQQAAANSETAAAGSEAASADYLAQIGTHTAGAVADWLKENLQPTTPPVDSTLSIAGAAADAKKTGDAVSGLNNNVSDLKSAFTARTNAVDMTDVFAHYQGTYDDNNQLVQNTNRVCTNFKSINGLMVDEIHVKSGYKYIIKAIVNGNNYAIVRSNLDETYKELILSSSAIWLEEDITIAEIKTYIQDASLQIAIIAARKDDADFINFGDAVELIYYKDKPKFEQIYTSFIKASLNDDNTRTDGSDYSKTCNKRDIEFADGDRFFILNPDRFNMVSYVSHGVKQTLKIPCCEIVPDTHPFIIEVSRADGGIVQAPHSGIAIYKVNSQGCAGYDAVIAASDSSETDKARADYTCTGTCDGLILTAFANANVTCSAYSKILLLPGTYYIDRFINYQNVLKFYGIVIIPSVNNGGYHTVSINGMYPEYVSSIDRTGLMPGTKIVETETARTNLNYEYYLIGGARNGDTPGWIGGNYLGAYIKNITFIPYSYKRQNLICIDGYGLCQLGCENIITRPADYLGNGTINFANSDIGGYTIGIRGVMGSNRGMGNFIRHCITYAENEGIALLGEHFIIEDCIQYNCNIGFTVGNYPVVEKMEHPNVFIGNSVEQCKRFAILNRNGASKESDAYGIAETIIYIGGSTESEWTYSGKSTPMLPVKEIVRGAYGGSFETDFSLMPIFESGSGKYITARDTQQKPAGSNGDMNYAKTGRHVGDVFFNAERGYPVWWNGSNWINAIGEVIS